MKVRILSNGCGDIIVAAEIERRGRKDYIPAENWRELEPAARDYLALRGVPVSEAGNFDCPEQLAERARCCTRPHGRVRIETSLKDMG